MSGYPSVSFSGHSFCVYSISVAGCVVGGKKQQEWTTSDQIKGGKEKGLGLGECGVQRVIGLGSDNERIRKNEREEDSM